MVGIAILLSPFLLMLLVDAMFMRGWDLFAAPADDAKPEADERIYPCVKCGTLRSKDEGGTTFTVCDECWDAKPEAGRT